MSKTHTIATTSSEDMLKIREWTGSFISAPFCLPISFIFDKRAIAGIPEDWQPISNRRRIDANISETIFEGNDAKSGLNVRVECTEYRDYPVVEWVAWFSNKGNEITPLISDILAIDGMFKGSSPILYHCNGDCGNEKGYTPHETSLNVGDMLKFAPNGGRPCHGAFPYYRVMFNGCGLFLSVGWPGQWAASFQRLADGVHIRAGQEKTNLRLMPGESIRTPRITVLSWVGETSRAVNLWRRWYLAHILPRPNGRPMKPLLACAGTDEGEEYTTATEENQIRYIERFKKYDIHPNVWWIDAGWYSCHNKNHERKWPITGTWEPDPERFPNGLKPVSDCAARNGIDLLVWFEPERVAPSSKLEIEHPEWLLRSNDGNEWMKKQTGGLSSLSNLGNPKCRQWLTDHICNLIKDNGIKIYRQDFNFAPLDFWRKNENHDRQGMNENLHIQGYLQFWDDLLSRNPGLWIDSCASGGLRNDLETMRRAVPLHYSDYGYGDNPVKLAFHHTLYEWIPYFKECTLSWDIGEKGRFDNRADSYSYHCGMAPMLLLSLDIRRGDYDYNIVRKMIRIWRKASELILYGDYYPLTPFSRNAKKWLVRQFDCPERDCGLVQGIRFSDCPEESFTVHPKGMLPDATYFFENVETAETRDISGAILSLNGFTFSLPARSGAIWFYRKKSGL